MISKHTVQDSDVPVSRWDKLIALRTGHFAIIILLLLAVGSLFSWWMVDRADGEMRAELLQQTRLVAQAVNIDRVKTLTGTETDLKNPDYLRLKEQLAAIRLANPQCRFLYLLGHKADGKLFFYVDSEPADSKDYSPPGQIYEEATAAYRRVFDNITAATEGPVTDRWGTWVSGFVPLTDPQTGTVVSVLGMDMDARAWKWRVAAQAALPVGLMLVLLIFVAAAFSFTRRVEASPKLLMRRMLVPLMAVVVFLTAGAGALLWKQYQQQVAGEITSDISRVSADLHIALEQQASGLTETVQPIVADPRVQKGLHEGDANRLLAVWQPVFETMQRENHLTHLYFFDSNRICLLRVHAPQKRGDLINRFTALAAERTGKTASGIELGPLGTFTLRVVQPVFAQGKLIGYVELGKEIEDVLQTLHTRLGTQLAVIIRKEHLNRQAWEAGMRMLGRDADWDRLPRNAVIYASRDRLPDAFASWADSAADERSPIETHREIIFEGKDWRASATPMQDASGKAVGDLLILRDISAEKAAFTRLIALGGAAGIVLLSLLLAFIYILLKRTDASISTQQKSLRDSESKYHFLAESMADVAFTVDMNMATTYVSPSIEKMLGFTPAERMNQKADEQLTPESQKMIFEALLAELEREKEGAADPNRSATLELEYYHKDGSIKILSTYIRGIRNSEGNLTGFYGSHHDITERRQMEETLRQSEYKHRSFIENSHDGYFEIDLTGNYTFFNESQCEINGYPKEELMGMNNRQYVDKENAKKVFVAFSEIYKTGIAGTVFDYEIIRKDGTKRQVEVSASLIKDSSGNPIGYRGTTRDVTERKKMEDAMRLSEEKYRTILDEMEDAYLELDLAGNFTFVNDATCRHSGYSREEMIGRSFRSQMGKEDFEKMYKIFGNIYITGQPERNIFYKLIRKNGTTAFAELAGFPLKNQKGEIIGFRGVGRDVTERKLAEETLKESEVLFRSYLENAPDGIYMSDLEGNFLYGNRRCEEIIGYRREELIGKNFLELNLLPESSLNKAAQLLQANIEGKSTGPDEMELMNKEGHLIPVEINTNVVKRQGQIIVLAFVRDITMRRQTEETLRESEARYRLLSDHMRDAIWLIDMNLKTIYISPSTQKWRGMGYAMSELLEMPLDQNLTPVSLELAMEVFAEEMPRVAEDSAYSFVRTLELEFYRKDGTTFWAETTFSLIRDESENPQYLLGESRDISERKQAEDALLKTNLQLEDAIAHANQMTIQAELANIAKSDFLANMSHEIRTPMNGVMGMTSLLLETELSEEQRKYAGIVQTSGESLLGILNDILDFSKMEAGKVEIEKLDFDLHDMFDDFAAVLALRAQDKGLEFICAAAPDVPAYLRGDPGRLRQILTNLTGNAVKFTNKGEISVRASLISENDTEAVVRFSVKDTGIGIQEHKQALMFQKFTQADTSTTRKYGGTGLGLAISKQLVELMGGDIGIISPSAGSTGSPQAGRRTGEGGLGSEFWFTVCLGKQAGRERDSAPPADIRNAHILVVDDNATNRDVLMTQFKAWGVQGEDAPDGAEALKSLYRACAEGNPFRIAILDMQMPGMDGATLARTIKADEKLKDTRLVLLTSLGQRGDAKKMEQIGFAAYLTKPTRQSEMFACLAAVLTGKALPQSSQPLVTRHSIREMRWGAVRILLAEDNIVNQQVAVGILKKLGLRADIAINGAEAVKVLETLSYDLVLMDMQMPVMNGIEATMQIRNPRSTVKNHLIPIIAMTANAMQGDREKCLKAGMNDYITKPVLPNALAEVLEKWLPKKEDEYPISNALKGICDTQFPKTKEIDENAPDIKSLDIGHSLLDIGNSQIPIFDKAGMMERVMDDEELAQNLIEVFLDDIPHQLETLRGYLEAGNIAGAEHQSHTIKGASANVGGEALRAISFEMEKAAKAGNLEAVKNLLPEMITQFGRLKEEMGQG